MKKVINDKCPNCGAPLTTEICPYCQNMTGLDTATANMEYPAIECKEANINFWNTWFPMIFAVFFGFFGFIVPIFFIAINAANSVIVLLLCSIFGFIGLVSFIISVKTIIRHYLVKAKGTEIEATVYGYMNDNILLNGSPAQIVKLLVAAKEGPRFILYQLKDTKHPYKINSKIKLLVYKNIFKVKDDNKYHFD